MILITQRIHQVERELKTGTQSFIAEFSFSLAQKLWVILWNSDLLVQN